MNSTDPSGLAAGGLLFNIHHGQDGVGFMLGSKSHASTNDEIGQAEASYEQMVEYHFSGLAALDREIAQMAAYAAQPTSFSASYVGIGNTPQYADLKASNGACSIGVTWDGNKVIESGDRIGFPFTVNIRIKSGRIGRVGDLSDPRVEGDLHNGGKWEVGQKIWSWTRTQFGKNGEVTDSETQTKDDSPLPVHRTIGKNRGSWHDTPGLANSNGLARIWNGEAKFNIIAYAMNGKNYCSVAFHIRMSVVDGNPILREVGEGHYK